MPTDTLTEADYDAAATAIGCEAAAIKAVVMTEVGGNPQGMFDGEGRPTILFERHIFSKLTGHRFDGAYPDISNRVPGGYGHFSEQYPKLERAIALDHDAGLKAASWGAFQILGENCIQAGFASVNDFVTAMKTSAQHQMTAFVAFIKADRNLTTAMQTKDWTGFAAHYNGPAYKENGYDAKMKANYEKAAGA